MFLGWNRQIYNTVHRIDNPVEASPSLNVHNGIDLGDNDITGADDVRAPEKDDTVPVGVRCRLINNLDGLAVEKKILLAMNIRIGGPGTRWRRRLHTRRRTHAVENVFMGDDCGTFTRIPDIARDVAAGDR